MVRQSDMPELESPSTPRKGSRASTRADRPPRVDEGLDDWFARRLEARGIRAARRRRHLPVTRLLALLALFAAMGGVGWAVASTGHDSAAPAKHHAARHRGAHHRRARGGANTKTRASSPVSWRSVTVDVLNGYGGGGAASRAAEALRAKGWKVGQIGDAGTETTKTVVVFAPGHRRQARAVAKRLKLGQPKALAAAAGVPAGATKGVAIVLGTQGLPLPV